MLTKRCAILVGLTLCGVGLVSHLLNGSAKNGKMWHSKKNVAISAVTLLNGHNEDISKLWGKCESALTSALPNNLGKAPIQVGAQLYTLSDGGKEKMEPLTERSLKAWKKDAGVLMTHSHKVMHLKSSNSLVLMYNDNMVVTATAKPCAVTGVFAPTKKREVHPAVSRAIEQSSDVRVMADKGGSSCKWEEHSCAVNSDCCDSGEHSGSGPAEERTPHQVCCIEDYRYQCLYLVNWHKSAWCDHDNLPEIPHWNSIGCFYDKFCDGQGRSLSGASMVSNSMTINKCVSFCSSRGYKYAGVEFGKECFCGNSLEYKRQMRCNHRCAGNSKQWCGGYCGLIVYRRE